MTNLPAPLRDPAPMLERALQEWGGHQDLWIFGYGSLIWRPDFDYAERRPAKVHGWHRALKMWSRINRGTPERPGAGVYLAYCAKCHGADGHGTPDKAPPLAGSTLTLSADPTSVLRLVVEGSASPQTAGGGAPRKMPGFHTKLTDSEVAQVVSFVRGAWGNNAAPIAPADVTRLRAAIHQ